MAGDGAVILGVSWAAVPLSPFSMQHDGALACQPFLQQACASFAFPVGAEGIMQRPFDVTLRKLSAKRKTVARRCTRKNDMFR